MGTLVTYNGGNYTVPSYDDDGWAQGSGNLTLYLIALATGSLQQTGGNFTLSADANFGASFGLISLYYKSFSSNIATGGVLRLANTDTIDWRNFANSDNNALGVNASDQLTYNGVPINTTASTVTVPQGGTGDTSFTPYAVIAGGTTSAGPLQSVASVGTAGQILTSNGAGALPTFQNTAGSGTVNNGTQYQLAYYAATGAVISGDSSITTNAGNQLLVPGGSMGAPSYSFSGSTNTGLWETSNTLIVSAGGSQAWSFGPSTVFAGVPLNMSANKITGLVNGSAAQDAVAFNQLTTGGAITSGGIASDTVTGSTANSGGSAGNIDQGTISTPDLRANAVTNTAISTTSFSTPGGAGSATTTTLTTLGSPVLLNFSFSISKSVSTGQYTVTAFVLCDGSPVPGAIDSMSNVNPSVAQTLYFSLHGSTIHTPSAGTHTYDLQYTISSGSGYSSPGYTLAAVEFRA